MVMTARPHREGTWTESARKVMRERYLHLNADGSPETPEDMCWRVARCVAEAELRHGASAGTVQIWAERFYDLMVSSTFLPNSPTLMNAGRDNGLQFSACFVLPIEDSLDGIFESIKRAAIIHKSGGGTGFSFSRLRAKDETVASTSGKASGPVSFLRVFNAATEAVKQGGTRRGANMGILRVDHPDIQEFITCKLDGGITNFNISVAITDEFMRALAEERDYALIDPHTKGEVRRLPARQVFDELVDAAWKSGDPGVVFIDRINNSPANPTPEVWEIEATNPCGEQPLAPNEACNLGSLNVAAFLKPAVGARWGKNAEDQIDWDSLADTVAACVRFLDDVIDVNPYPLPEITAAVTANRRIGLGVMGWADLLLELGVPYDSEEALKLASRLMRAIRDAGHRATEQLAVERGPFPNWSRSIYKTQAPRRNSTVTTIAPTGTISIIAGCSSGIEPLFALAFRHKAPGQDRLLTFVNPILERIGNDQGWYQDSIGDDVAAGGMVHGVAGVPDAVQRVFVTAHEVAPPWHVRMQAAWQNATDNAVSKTINLPNEASHQDVEDAYRLAYSEGCLGITVFRDGCKGMDFQVLHVGSKDGAKAAEAPALAPVAAEMPVVKRPRATIVQGYTRQLTAPEGKINVTLNSDDLGLLEVFLNVGKAGSDIAALAEAVGRLVSLIQRLPSPLPPNERAQEIIEQLRGIGGSRSVGFGPAQIRSLPDAVAVALEGHLAGIAAGLVPTPAAKVNGSANGSSNGNGHTNGGYTNGGTATSVAVLTSTMTMTGNLCPDCGCQTLALEEGCKKCHSCGYSEC